MTLKFCACRADPTSPSTTTTMPPSASKQKRLAEKAAKQAAKVKGAASSTATSTPTESVNGGSATNTPLTSMSAATSQEDLSAMAKLQIATDRCVRAGFGAWGTRRCDADRCV